MRMFLFLLLVGGIGMNDIAAKSMENEVTAPTASIKIEQISRHVYRHTSLLRSEEFGDVPCHGMIVAVEREAVIFDTPTDREASAALIEWVEKELDCEIIAVIPTHFHTDCLGGLEVFHERAIPSYANQRTLQLAAVKETAIPEHGFAERLELPVGDVRVVAEYLGAGHTKDNIVGYFPMEKILFGGCLIKEVGAAKGNLQDADIEAWPLTAARVKARFPEIELVVPGHGEPGGMELIDYTIELFAAESEPRAQIPPL